MTSQIVESTICDWRDSTSTRIKADFLCTEIVFPLKTWTGLSQWQAERSTSKGSKASKNCPFSMVQCAPIPSIVVEYTVLEKETICKIDRCVHAGRRCTEEVGIDRMSDSSRPKAVICKVNRGMTTAMGLQRFKDNSNISVLCFD